MSRRIDNEIVLLDDHAEVLLYDKNGREKSRALIDLDDVPLVSKYRWWENRYGYARGYVNGNEIFLHNFIIGQKGVDHKDRNKLNNKRKNLRLATVAQNSMNRVAQSNSKTGHPGIIFDNRRKNFRTYIKIKGKQIHLGGFVKLEDAIAARRQAEEKYFGDFRCRNEEVYSDVHN